MNTQRIAEYATQYLSSELLTDQLTQELMEKTLSAAQEDDAQTLIGLGFNMGSYFSGVKGNNLPPIFARFNPSLRSKKEAAEAAYNEFFNKVGIRQMVKSMRPDAQAGKAVMAQDPSGFYYPHPNPVVTGRPKALYLAWMEVEFAWSALGNLNQMIINGSDGQIGYQQTMEINPVLDPAKVPALVQMIEAGLYDPETDQYIGQ